MSNDIWYYTDVIIFNYNYSLKANGNDFIKKECILIDFATLVMEFPLKIYLIKYFFCQKDSFLPFLLRIKKIRKF